MTAPISTVSPAQLAQMLPPAARPPAGAAKDQSELRGAFDSFVGEVFYGQMLKAMRKSTGKPAYFHGGRTEEIFTQQLDQILAEKLSTTSAHGLSGPMFELFNMRRQ